MGRFKGLSVASPQKLLTAIRRHLEGTLLHVAAEWAEVLCIWEVPSSYLGQGTVYPELLLVFFSPSKQILGHYLKDRDSRPTTVPDQYLKCRNSTSNSRTIPQVQEQYLK